MFKPSPPEGKIIMDQSMECPFCSHQFKQPTARASLLKLDKMEKDLRPRHRGIDATYYEIATCPSCLYSAFTAQFEKAMTSREDQLNKILRPFKGEFNFKGYDPLNVNYTFAGYYLALLAVPLCFTGPAMVNARLWMRISWLYSDCGDAKLTEYAQKKALEAYVTAFETINMPASQIQQVNLMIGELNFILKDFEAARKFLFQAKISKEGSPAIARQADDRIAEMREIEAGQ
jgi:uncharacterized protein (DUF2225 family)